MSDYPHMQGMDPMGDTLKFMRGLWGGVKMPGVSLPSLSVEDLDKQISDLKAVEGWLALNMQMLKATIQTMEVQRATLSALQSMGQNVSASMGQNMEKAVDAAMSAAGAMTAGMNTMNPMGKAAGAAEPVQPVDSPVNPPGMPGFSFAAPQADKPAPPPAEDEPAPEVQAKGPDGIADMVGAAAPFVDPAAWWGLLQDQFKQAMDSASAMTKLAEDVRPTRRPAAKKAVSKSASKSAGKSTKSAGKVAAKGAAKKSTKATAGSRAASKSAKPKRKPARKS